ncbi:MAG: ribosomal protein S18-alanine N-acetyltransferase [Gammaproteobacteria bacterium]|nr:ribosomal protein S18-alanine N-acetyltransferase [Gammaproteobacteria bacterium]
MSEYTLREICDADLPDLLILEEKTQKAPWSEEAFRRCRIAEYPGWVLEKDEKILGFVMISLSVNECHLLNLCVDPAYQGKKLGQKLLVTALKWAKQKGAYIVYLEVRRSNFKAIKLYLKMHFSEIGVRKNYYPKEDGGEDALVLARDISVDELEDI